MTTIETGKLFIESKTGELNYHVFLIDPETGLEAINVIEKEFNA